MMTSPKEIKYKFYHRDHGYSRPYTLAEINGLTYLHFRYLNDTVINLFEPGIECIKYTGIKDVNGKEIYEGDVVRVSPHNTTYEVSFHNGCFLIGNFNTAECKPLYAVSHLVKLVGNKGDSNAI